MPATLSFLEHLTLQLRNRTDHPLPVNYDSARQNLGFEGAFCIH